MGEIRIISVYGYCRVSTPTQNLERQARNILKEYPDAVLYREAFTGTTMDRPEWKRLMKRVKSGDCIVFDSASRMARTADEGVSVYRECLNSGIELVFLKEHHIDTEVFRKAKEQAKIPTVTVEDKATDKLINGIIESVNCFMMELVDQQMRVAFQEAEKEVTDLKQRTREGIETARLNGKKKIGRQHGDYVKTRKEAQIVPKIMKLSRDFGGSLTDTECIELLGIARNTYYKYKKIAKNS